MLLKKEISSNPFEPHSVTHTLFFQAQVYLMMWPKAIVPMYFQQSFAVFASRDL
jgi:hypothetical protein